MIRAITTLLLISSTIIVASAQKFTVEPMTEARLKAIAAAADKSCPEILNRDTRLDSVRYLKGLILCNYYTMPNATAKEVAKLRQQTGDYKNDEGKKSPNSTYRVQHKFYDKKGVYMFTKTKYQ